MPKEPGETKEREPSNEVVIGNGDIVRITSLHEIGYEKIHKYGESPNVYNNELPLDELDKVREQLSRLPFHIGANEQQGVYGNSKEVHEAEIRFLEVSEVAGYKGPERRDLVFVFHSPDVLTHGIYPETTKGLEIHQDPVAKKGDERIIMNFTPEKALNLGDRHIKDIRLVLPIQEGNR